MKRDKSLPPTELGFNVGKEGTEVQNDGSREGSVVRGPTTRVGPWDVPVERRKYGVIC